MNKIIFLATSLMITLFISCEPDEIINEPDPKLNVVGLWSAGSVDIAPVLADSISSVVIRFRTDSTFTITQTNTDNLIVSYSGTYSIDKEGKSSDIYPITLNKTSPATGQYIGIFEINEIIEPEEMTLEIVQTIPNIGLTQPYPEFGFGSTNNGDLGTTNISRFQRIE